MGAGDDAPAPAARTIQLVGNSLLGAGVDKERLRRELAPAIDARSLVIEDTEYFDWFFGAQRLFKEGARPAVLALVLSEEQLLSSRIRGDFSARYMMTLPGAFAAAGATGADRDGTTSLLLANVSAFWGARGEIRKWLLGRLAPRVTTLLRDSRRPGPGAAVPADTYSPARERLRDLSGLLRGHDCELWVILPPRMRNPELTETFERAGRDEGVRVLVPLRPGALGRESFDDGFHLNAQGAALFTGAIIRIIEAGGPQQPLPRSPARP